MGETGGQEVNMGVHLLSFNARTLPVKQSLFLRSGPKLIDVSLWRDEALADLKMGDQCNAFVEERTHTHTLSATTNSLGLKKFSSLSASRKIDK